MNKARVRFAPSPTGFVHVGSLLTALYDWLIARQTGGTFILRIEDTDQKRFVPGSVENLLSVLKKVGLNPDEGVMLDKDGKAVQKGKFGPYVQSERLDIYRKYADQLIESGDAYYCFCSEERLTALREEQEKNKQLTRYDGHCRDISLEEAKARVAGGEKYVIRQRVPQDETMIHNDIIRGEVKFPLDSIDDSVLMKSDGFPTYHLAVVVDDHLMEITHVIRAQEWLPSTPKHLLLYRSFGWSAPQFAHMSHLLNKDRSKLSKRQGDVAVEDYLTQGYLPEALLNFLATVGWNEGDGSEQEIYSLDELIRKFSLEKIHKTAAYFDREKLDWINGIYIRNLSVEKLTDLCLPYLESEIKNSKADMTYLRNIIALEQERLKKLADLPGLVSYFFVDLPDYPTEMLVWKKSTAEVTKKNIEMLFDFMFGLKKWDKEHLEKEIIGWIGDNKLTNGEVLWPLRVALTGLEKSPGPFEVAAVLGREKSLARIKSAIESL
ncbi:MAG: glutamate--tRNA ligase [Patescibacteria group bacterium]|jgi:glutamyl/glutaminyl-tRNA synthetase